jgi:crotonobetainyl-CoA:carnitine CoA-transferase CaiB-like acyl-CoA transferase
MVAPLDGIRVLEVANWLAAPAATALMADLGADVIKVEPPGGDIYRQFVLRSLGYDYDFETNYAFQLDNRGKRSVTVALDRPGGPELVRRMARDVDIVVTNLIHERCVKYGLTYEDVHAANPGVIYVSFSGYGTRGPDANRAGFDFAAFWAAGGVMGLMAEPDAPPPLCRGGQGDHTTALNVLAATLAALRLRDRTGEGQHVETTLQAAGMWTIAGDYSAALVARSDATRLSRNKPTNPIWNTYQCADGQWLLLVMPVPFPNYWPRFCQAVERPDWLTDPRSADLTTLRAHTAEFSAALDVIFARHPRPYWMAKLDEQGLIWANVAKTTEVIADPQVREMGWIAEIDHPQFGKFETLDTPFKIYGSDIGVRGPAPDAGQHTFDILAEFGVSEDEVATLATDGVLG